MATVNISTSTNIVSISPGGSTGVVQLLSKGPKGDPGASGSIGLQGPSGSIGPIGPSGSIGPVGPVGPEGPQGIQGPIGPVGPSGSQGIEGPIGPQGVQGVQGIQGPAGPAGLTWRGLWSSSGSYVTDDAVGYGGASYFCISDVSGSSNTPDSDNISWALLASQGAEGPQGPVGPTGPTGPRGVQGVTGPTGPIGPQGVRGPRGFTGATGPRGIAGENGIAATASFALTGSNHFRGSQVVTGSVTASYYLGDGSTLYNLPSNTNWNKRRTYTVKNSEQLFFVGDYIIEDSSLIVEGNIPNSIGDWTEVITSGNGESIRTGDKTFTINGSNDESGEAFIYIKKYFGTETTASIWYRWSNQDLGEDWPIYEVTSNEPTGEISTDVRLINTGSIYENRNWTIEIPADHWLSIGVYSTDSLYGTGSLNITLPYTEVEEVQYSTSKSFKKEGSIFINGNLLVKDSHIQNDGKIFVRGEVVLVGDSQIVGTGTIT